VSKQTIHDLPQTAPSKRGIVPPLHEIVDEFYDAAVSGGDPVHERPGFKAMLDHIAGNGVRCIIVESPDPCFGACENCSSPQV
jgi:hypothetical protein